MNIWKFFEVLILGKQIFKLVLGIFWVSALWKKYHSKSVWLDVKHEIATATLTTYLDLFTKTPFRPLKSCDPVSLQRVQERKFCFAVKWTEIVTWKGKGKRRGDNEGKTTKQKMFKQKKYIFSEESDSIRYTFVRCCSVVLKAQNIVEPWERCK